MTKSKLIKRNHRKAQHLFKKALEVFPDTSKGVFPSTDFLKDIFSNLFYVRMSINIRETWSQDSFLRFKKRQKETKRDKNGQIGTKTDIEKMERRIFVIANQNYF